MALIDTTERGVFAGQDFWAGFEVLEVTGRRVRWANPLAQADAQLLQIDHALYLDLSGEPAGRVRHSCAPNCKVFFGADRISLVALRDILRGEEVTFDYATTSTENFYTWQEHCSCRHPACRGLLSGFPTLPERVQRELIRRGAVPPYVIEVVLPALLRLS